MPKKEQEQERELVQDQALLHLRVPNHLHQFYTDWARREHRSMTNLLLIVIENAANNEIERREKGEDIKYMPPIAHTQSRA